MFILLSGQSGEAYNIADGKANLSIYELAEIISKIGACGIRYETPDIEEKRGYNIVQKSVFNTSKIEELGWKPMTSIYDALLHTIDYLRNA